MSKALLVLNAGSSSVKFAVYTAFDVTKPVIHGQVSRIGQSPVYEDSSGDEQPLSLLNNSGHGAVLGWLLETIESKLNGLSLEAVGHRVVHGGASLSAPVVINQGVLRKLTSLVGLAPNHEPHNISGIKAVSKRWPSLLQVACFDTSFHRTQSRVAELFPLTRNLADQGVIRYGFHGLSYAYIASVLPDYLAEQSQGRVLVLHLGHGCSICAMKACRSVSSTMGFSSQGGLMMGKRSGDLDPGVLIHLMKSGDYDLDSLEHLLNFESGLLGMSGISDDVRDLLQSSAPEAVQALDLFVYRIVQAMGSLIAVLEGIDAIIFTAGIGENSAEIRRRVISRFSWLGVALDESRNHGQGALISSENSSIKVLKLRTDEEQVIARETRRMVTEMVQ